MLSRSTIKAFVFNKLFAAAACSIAMLSIGLNAGAAGTAPESLIKQDFVAAKLKPYDHACFELLDCKSGKFFRYNEEQCKTRLSPMSTFKIFNSLAGLESGFLKDENHPMKWDGQKRWIDSWNQDQTLQSAVTNSCVWYFQKVAAGVGEERMQKYISAVHYGNEDISSGITQFWLNKSLKISADEQVDFVKRLYFDELPFSKRSMKIVRKLIDLKKTEKGELHGKTGTDRENDKDTLGWFVGYVVHDGKPYVFATNIQSSEGAFGKKAREITESILQDAGLL